MMDWFEKLPEWFQMLTVLLVAAVLLCALELVKRGVKIRYGKLQVGKVENEDKRKSPHAGCPHSKDVVLIITKAVDIVSKKLRIDHFELLRLQMNYAEELVQKLLALLQKTYLGLLRDKSMTNLVESPSFQVYRLILLVGKDYLLATLRFSFREDRLSDMSDAEFREYLDNKIDSIVAKGSAHFNDHYFFSKDVTREELYQANVKHLQEYEAILKDIFEHARRHSQDSRLAQDKLDQKLENLMAGVVE